MLTRLWGSDPALASAVAPEIGSDVPACLLSMTARGSGAGDDLVLADTAIRAQDIDEASVRKAKEEAERILANRGEAMEVAEAQQKLAEAVVQLQALERLRKNLKH